MSNCVVCYCYICQLKYHSKCSDQLRLTKGSVSVILEKKNSHNAKVCSNDMQRASSGSRKSL